MPAAMSVVTVDSDGEAARGPSRASKRIACSLGYSARCRLPPLLLLQMASLKRLTTTTTTTTSVYGCKSGGRVGLPSPAVGDEYRL